MYEQLAVDFDKHPLFMSGLVALGLIGFVHAFFASLLELRSPGEGGAYAKKAVVFGLAPIVLGVVALVYTRMIADEIAGRLYAPEHARELGYATAMLRFYVGAAAGSIPFLGGVMLLVIGAPVARSPARSV